MIARQMRNEMGVAWKQNERVGDSYSCFEKRDEKVSSGIAGQLGLTSEELAAIVAHGGGSKEGVVITVGKAIAVHTANGNPWAVY
ncbi:hypothetical protein CL619_04565 [archaeon]|nr:hypothetical protein [archaeon]|tara:strand:+ start:1157 stop:1411 length:255 start_codon:yes stop_codon:yes gene_type:complete